MTVPEAAFTQVEEPPATVGAVGAVRSSLTVACAHGETSPTPSTAANCTSVVPCAETTALAPAVAADHVLPPLAEVSYSYPATPEPASVDPAAVTVTVGPACHDVEPPVSVGAVGAVRSMLTVPFTQAETLPTASTDRNCTSVSPSAEIVTEVPGVAVDQVLPPLLEVRYW